MEKVSVLWSLLELVMDKFSLESLLRGNNESALSGSCHQTTAKIVFPWAASENVSFTVLESSKSDVVLRNREKEQSTIPTIHSEIPFLAHSLLNQIFSPNFVLFRVQLHNCLYILCWVCDRNLNGSSDTTYSKVNIGLKNKYEKTYRQLLPKEEKALCFQTFYL